MHLGIKIRQIREEMKLSEQNVADMIGESQSNYSKLESGKIRVTMEKLEKLGKAFNKTPDKIITHDDLPNYLENNNQSGGHAANVIWEPPNEKIVAAKDETIAVLRTELGGKDAIIAFLQEEMVHWRTFAESLQVRA